METLNLPSYTPKTKAAEGRTQIFDPLQGCCDNRRIEQGRGQ